MHQHILIATDGSDLAEKAVSHGLALARQLGAKVTILTATEIWSALEMSRRAERPENPIEAYQRKASEYAEKVLAGAAEAARNAGVACDTVYMPEASPAEAIVETAVARGCDLIVMASHSRRGINKLLLGSVTSRVLALTTIPVLVYR